MPLEATIVCVDSSDFMRNGDYTPTRLEAQHDAVNLICNAKTQSNPESTVGVIACGGKSPAVLVTLTNDIGKVLTSLHSLKIGGGLSLVNGIQVAQLVLKHRQNKSQQQRIIFFVGSPIQEDKDGLVRLGKRLKKNNIAVDIVNFGEESENADKLDAFMSAVNSDENSHLVTIPPGPHVLSDILISSPIVSEGGAGAGGRSNDFDAYGGVDPSMDPELALALKMSMDEERARQEAARVKEGGAPEAPAESTPAVSQPAGDHMMADDDDDELLRQAIAMSMVPTETPTPTPAPTPAPVSTPAQTTTAAPAVQDAMMEDPMDEDAEMRLALQMSMAASEGGDLDNVMADPNFMNEVIASLPGVDPNDPEIKKMIEQMSKQRENEK